MTQATELPGSDLYFCPAAREVESATGGGFSTCCDRPQDHVPMPDSPATAAVSEALSEAVKREFKLSQQLAELNTAIMWETACLNCSSMLTRSYEDYCRSDALTVAVQAVANELTQSGVHDAAERLGDLIDRYQETASGKPPFPLPLRPDGTHWYVSTYCLHSRCAQCRLTCLCCGEPCQCADCEHEPSTPVAASEATANEESPAVGGIVQTSIIWGEGGPNCGMLPARPPQRSEAVQRRVAERFGLPLPTPATQVSAVAAPATRSEEDQAATLARIRQAWIALDYAGDRLAAVGMDHARWRQIVDGERRPTSLDFALIAEAFEKTVDWLLSGAVDESTGEAPQ